MEFEDLKKVWDTQNNEHLYAINESALHKQVIRKNITTQRNARINEISMIVLGLIVASFMITMGVINSSWVFLPQGLIFLGITSYVMIDRKKRREIAGFSTGSVLNDLDQAIRTNDYEIKRQKNMLWWFFLPAVLAALLNLFKTNGIFTWAVIILLVTAFSLGLIVQKKSIKPYITKKNDLNTLKKLLTEADNQ